MEVKRKHLRFPPEDHKTMALLDAAPTRPFNPTYCGVVFSESAGGCGVVLRFSNDLKIGQQLRVKVGELEPLLAKIAWIQVVDQDVMKVGIEILE